MPKRNFWQELRAAKGGAPTTRWFGLTGYVTLSCWGESLYNKFKEAGYDDEDAMVRTLAQGYNYGITSPVAPPSYGPGVTPPGCPPPPGAPPPISPAPGPPPPAPTYTPFFWNPGGEIPVGTGRFPGAERDVHIAAWP